MRRGGRGVFLLALLGVLLISGSCNIGIADPDETIIIQNRSGINGVEVYIDDIFKGKVDDGNDLELTGKYSGNRKFYAKGSNRVWGPSYFEVPENGAITLVIP